MAGNAGHRLRRKGTAVLAAVLPALGVVAVTTQTWLRVDLPPGPVQVPDIQVPGSDAATAVTALAVVALAAGIAAGIAGRIGRMVAASILTAAGVGIAWVSWRTAVEPEGAAAPAVGQATGLGEVAGAAVTVTAMPWVASLLGLVLVAAGLLMLATGRHWQDSRRYSAPADPGSATASSAAGPYPGGGRDARPAEDGDDIDSWDRLSRGEDPTR